MASAVAEGARAAGASVDIKRVACSLAQVADRRSAARARTRHRLAAARRSGRNATVSSSARSLTDPKSAVFWTSARRSAIITLGESRSNAVSRKARGAIGVAVKASERPHLGARHRVAAFLYACVAVASLVLGAIYLFRDSFMPYHAVALGKDWGELDSATQTLIKALMEVAASGWLALGVLVLLLIGFPIRRGERWARLAAPAALLLFYVPTLLATLSVLHETPAVPPWRFNVVACLCAVVGFLLDAPWRSATVTERGNA